MNFADIILDITNSQLNKTFEYKIPASLDNVLEVGHRVKVPFGRKKLLGFVVNIKNESTIDTTKIKEIDELLDIKPVLNEEFIDLAKYLSNKYYSFMISNLKNMIPEALRVKYQNKAHVINRNLLDDDIKELFKNDLYLIKVNDPYLSKIKKNVNNGALELLADFSNKGSEKEVSMVRLIDENITYKSSKASELINYLKELNEDVELSLLTVDMGFSRSVIDTLYKHQNIDIYKDSVYREPKILELKDKKVNLNESQEEAYLSIKKYFNTFKTTLIHGVTGSGKTEIYLKLIEDVINEGKEAIMLVPEISLTPQMNARFKARFKDKVAVLHSRLSMGEKYDEWRRILNGSAKICIGARSAIFAPFKNLGIIIVDESHEKSYIQDTNPKYDAIDVAKYRAEYHNIPLILGSATPRVDTYYRAINGEYELINLSKRANNKSLPPTKIIDMRQEIKSGNKSIFSSDLKEALIKRYEKGEQSILFLNKRGFSSFVMCRGCGYTINCPNCSTSLTYHKNSLRLKCHYCGYEMIPPKVCPKCGSSYIRYVGGGTEKIVEEVEKILPGVKVIRVDTDTTRKKGSFESMFDSFRKEEADVMVGTQIVAKGLDFAKVTLVGVINADLSLKLPFYDSQEITYDLLEQVSGRAGRAELSGEVIIQTYNPDNFVIKCAKNHDYKSFYDLEIKERKMTNNPPFSTRVEIKVSSKIQNNAFIEANKIIKLIKSKTKESKIFGPSEDFMFKLNEEFRYLITIMFHTDEVSEILRELNNMYQDSKNIKIDIKRM